MPPPPSQAGLRDHMQHMHNTADTAAAAAICNGHLSRTCTADPTREENIAVVITST